MLQYTFDAALGSGALDFIILSSDDSDAISLASQSGIHAPFNRPAILSQDNSKSTEDNITTKRPAKGINPMHWNMVIGEKAKKDFVEDEPVEL